ncbi:MAG: triose-phosphate isomerase, partial [Mogibacterium sp.]|nr:triose-phosphate isomerase [Mogibacterium sp.]
MKKFLIAGNWKMNKTESEAAELVEALKAKNITNPEQVCVCVPFTDLRTVK